MAERAAAAQRYLTPPPTHPPLSKLLETPYSISKTLGRQFSGASLDGKREMICYDVGPVTRQVPIDYFLQHLLPPVRAQINLVQLVEKLKNEGKIFDGRFSELPDDPIDIHGTEIRIFAPVGTIANDIIKAARWDGAKVKVKFFNKGNITPTSKNRPWSAKPDFIGLLTPCKENETPEWVHIVVSAEFKISDSPDAVYDNELKAVGSMQHCMAEDPRKRGSVAITIENNKLRLWIATRAWMIVSEAMNYIEEQLKTAHIFVSLAFALEDQLGYDPTIKRRADGTYDIKVFVRPSKFRLFHTIALVSDKSTDSVNGPGTRIWTVREVENKADVGPLLTLKDGWIEEDRQREGDIFQEMLTAQPSDKRHGQAVRRLFLNVLCHGDVRIRGKADTTDAFLHGAEFPPESSRYPLVAPTTVDQTTQTGTPGDHETPGEHHWAALRENMLPTITPASMVHCRVVYNGLHRPLYTETGFTAIFSALSMSCIAIQAMHEAGFVHRNLSTTTIGFDEDGKPRLTGVHDAKKTSDDSAIHPVRITALDFMAVEVKSRSLLFRPPETSEAGPAFAVHDFRDAVATDQVISHATRGQSFSTENAGSTRVPNETETPATQSKPLRYNYLHDLESLLWIAAYFLMKRRPVIDGKNTETTPQVEKLIDNIFVNRSERLNFLLSGDMCAELATYTHPLLRPAVNMLDDIRKLLVEAYQTAERDLAQGVILDLSECDLYSAMGYTFQNIASCDPTQRIALIPREASPTRFFSPLSFDSALPVDDTTAQEDDTAAQEDDIAAQADDTAAQEDDLDIDPTPRGHKRSREDEESEPESSKKLKGAPSSQ